MLALRVQLRPETTKSFLGMPGEELCSFGREMPERRPHLYRTPKDSLLRNRSSFFNLSFRHENPNASRHHEGPTPQKVKWIWPEATRYTAACAAEFVAFFLRPLRHTSQRSRKVRLQIMTVPLCLSPDSSEDPAEKPPVFSHSKNWSNSPQVFIVRAGAQ